MEIANTLKPRQNVYHFADDSFRYIVLYVWIYNIISLKFVPKGQINNISSLVKIIASHQAIIWTNCG